MTRPTRPYKPRPTRLPHSLQIEYDQEDDFTDNLIENFDNHFSDDVEDDTTSNDVNYDGVPPLGLQLMTPADVAGRVKSLDEIFSSLHISSPGCQKMLVCHLAKDSAEYRQEPFLGFSTSASAKSAISNTLML